jgi:hypothetical protein
MGCEIQSAKFLPHFVASLEDPNRPAGQFSFLLLAALIERNGSFFRRVVLPVTEGNGPHTQKHFEHDVRLLLHEVYDTLNTPNIVNSNLILSNRSLCSFKYLLTLLPCLSFLRTFRVSLLSVSVYFRNFCSTGNTFNPVNAQLNLICQLLALLGDQPFLHVRKIGVK